MNTMWITTTDRDGRRAYVTPEGDIVSRDGCGPTPWTVLYAGGGYGMTSTMREAMAWAETD